MSRPERVTADDPTHLGFIGRISPQKGIADVFAISQATAMPVKALGLRRDEPCWRRAAERPPGAQVSYEGFLPPTTSRPRPAGAREC